METHPQVIIVGGPNGSGKSTIARKLVPADVIARGLSAANSAAVAFQAGRIMLARLQELAESRTSFAFETTLSARTYASWIGRLCDDGWIFRLIFVTLRNADLAVERVGLRVAAGGHSIPEQDIRRRFSRAHTNFRELYMPIAGKWAVFDNTFRSGPRRIAMGKQGRPPSIMDMGLWAQFCEVGNAK